MNHKFIIIKALEEHKKQLQKIIDMGKKNVLAPDQRAVEHDIGSAMWDLRRVENALEWVKKPDCVTAESLLMKHGGNWLGGIRSYVQSNFVNGSTLCWDEQETVLRGGPAPTLGEYQRIAARAAAQALNEYRFTELG